MINKVLKGRYNFQVGVLFLLLALAMLVLPFLTFNGSSPVFITLGRFHPLIIHFPIVIIFLVLVLEILMKYGWLKAPARLIGLLLSLASVSSMVVVLAGYFLYSSGEYTGLIVTRHFWGGVITAICILFTTYLFFLHRMAGKAFNSWYLSGLVMTNIAVIFTSHLGGSLTHGKDYLTEYLPFIFKSSDGFVMKEEGDMMVYEDLITPFMEAKCVNCHNDIKTKGGLKMNNLQSLLMAGKSGKTSLQPGKPDESEIYQRVILPLNHDEHMPPEGKLPLSHLEIEILKIWIEKGAQLNMPVEDIRQHEHMDSVLKQYRPESIKLNRKLAVQQHSLEVLIEELNNVALKMEVNIKEDLDDESGERRFSLSMQFPASTNFTGRELQELYPFFHLFSKVSLVSSNITDDDLYYLGKMTNLRELYLQKIRLDGSGLAYLKSLSNLQVLNLSYGEIEDAYLLELLEFPSLRRVYLLRTPVSQSVVNALRKHLPDLEILREEGPYF